jgi:hypothetical protein
MILMAPSVKEANAGGLIDHRDVKSAGDALLAESL